MNAALLNVNVTAARPVNVNVNWIIVNVVRR